MLCGGADEYDTTTVAVFDNLLACSVVQRHAPLTPRPFDVRRDGLVVGEGGGRPARRVRGGQAAGGRHPGRGDRLCLQQQRRRHDPAQHRRHRARPSSGSGQRPHRCRRRSIWSAPTPRPPRWATSSRPRPSPNLRPPSPVTGLKSYMGHTMGSCGVIETILTLYMMQEGFVAPTLNLERSTNGAP
jgi:3-oxoacyl-[acyl-carrier-protein] synthase II